MFRDFTWKFWLIGIVAAVIIGIPVVTRTPIQLGLDLQGGTMLTYRLEKIGAGDFDIVLKVLQDRLDILGMRQLDIHREGLDNFVVAVPGVDEQGIERIKKLIETSGHLRFMIVHVDQDRAKIEEIFHRKMEDLRSPLPDGVLRYDVENEPFDIALDGTGEEGPLPEGDTGSYVLVSNEGMMKGDMLTRAYPTVDDMMNPAVGFQWDAEGARLFYALTEKNKGRPLGIVLDGVLRSQPNIDEPIGARGIIHGRYTQEEVNDLVIILKGGSLPSAPIPESDLTVGPGLGRDSVERGKLAIWISLALVLGFTIFYYRGPGIVASLSLLFNLTLLVCILVAFEATLTLPGLAGIILTVGMAIDANILIFERIREEKNKGMGIRQAIENGYGRAFWTIFDANLTTLITALILFQVGTGPIKGFAVTLSIGIMTSLFTALFVTKAVFALLVVKGWVTEFSMLTLVKKPSIPFGRYQRFGIAISTLLILGGMAVFFARGQEKYGIEFTGGAVYQMRLIRPTAVSEVRSRVEGLGPEWRGAEIQAIASARGEMENPGDGGDRALPGRVSDEFQIRVRMLQEEGTKKIDPNVLKPALQREFAPDLAPIPFPTLPSRDEILKERGDPARGRIVLVVRLDPRLKELPDPSQVANDLAGIGFLDCKVEPGPEEESGVLSLRVTTGVIDIQPASEVVDAKDKLTNFFKRSVDYPISEPFPRVKEMGESVAYNLKSKAILAMVFAIFAIVLYVTFRFEFKFGLAAIVALVHDVFFALGAIATVDALGLLDLKIDLAMVTAFLTIIGYSLNDTIVVFDRIRESLGGREKLDYPELVNLSLNQTLSRTLLTSITTLIALLALFFAGVSVIRDFSFAMIIGVLVGTYSSIFIASPVLIFLRAREVRSEERERGLASQT